MQSKFGSELNVDETGFISLQSSENVENVYRKKFIVLKNVYEQRINQLTETLEKCCECFLTDEIVVSMTSDSISSAFVPSLLREIVQTSISCDRENTLMNIMEQDAVIRTSLQSKTDELARLRAYIDTLEEKCSKISEAAQSDKHIFQNRHDALNSELALLSKEIEVT